MSYPLKYAPYLNAGTKINTELIPSEYPYSKKNKKPELALYFSTLFLRILYSYLVFAQSLIQ